MRSNFGNGWHDRVTPLNRLLKASRPSYTSIKARTRSDVGLFGVSRSWLGHSLLAWSLKGRWLRGTCVVLSLTWIIFTHIIGPASRLNSSNHADGSEIPTRWWWRLRTHGTDAAPGSIHATLTSAPEGICSNLAVLKRDKDGCIVWINSLRAGLTTALRDDVAISRRPPDTVAPRPAILVVFLVVTAGDVDGDHEVKQLITKNQRTRLPVITRHHVGRISAASCAQVAASARRLRSSQTLPDFDVEMLAIGPVESLTRRYHACPGIKHFSADNLQLALDPTGIPDYVLFLGTSIDLHATTLEKMVLTARGRHADMVSIRTTGFDASDIVCLSPSPQHKNARKACQVKGAPILLRVPAGLSPPRLKNWAGAVVELVTGAGTRTRDFWPARNGLAFLFCAGNDLVVVHSLREHEMLVSERGSQTDRGIASSTNSCDHVRMLHPNLQPARAAFSGAYEALTSRDQNLIDATRHFDGPAADRVTFGVFGRRIRSQAKPSESRSSVSQRLRRRLLLRRTQSPNVPGFLLIVPWLDYGGADQFNVNLARALTWLNIRIVVVTTLSNAHPTARDFYAITPDVFHLPHLIASPRDTPEILNVFTHLIVSRNVDTVMISHSALGYKLLSHMRNALKAMRHVPVKFVDFVHLEEMEWGDGGYAAMSVTHARHLDHTFAASQHVATWMKQKDISLNDGAKQLSKSAQWDEHEWGHRITVAYIGVDTQALRPLSVREKERVRSKLLMPSLTEIDTNKPMIAYIARMVDQKMPELFFEIMRQLREERHVEFTSLAIGGGPKLPELRANISQHPLLEGAVLTLDMLDHSATIRALAAADVLLLPSRNEGISLAVYEAMALGVTPVVSAVGGQCELVANGAGACVLLDEPATDKGRSGIAATATPFVDELERLFSSRELIFQRSRSARQRVEREFDIANAILALRSGLCSWQ